MFGYLVGCIFIGAGAMLAMWFGYGVALYEIERKVNLKPLLLILFFSMLLSFFITILIFARAVTG